MQEVSAQWQRCVPGQGVVMQLVYPACQSSPWMVLGNGTATARHPAEKTARPVPPASVVRWGWDLWCDSVPVLAFLGILSQLEVAATTQCPLHSHQLLCLCSGVVAPWHWASVVLGVYVLLWAITNEPELLFFSLPKTGSGQFHLGQFPVCPLGRLWFILVSGPP